MENLSHSRRPNRVVSQAAATLNKRTATSNGANSFSGRTVYDDVFGGVQRFGTGGGPTLSPRPEDYSEIFGGFHASRGASIPVLDLPLIDSNNGAMFDVRNPRFNYAEVFGGFDGSDFAATYEELIRQADGSDRHDYDGDSSDEAWMQDETEFLSEGSDHSGNCQYFSNGDYYEPVDSSMEFNMSYHKANVRSNRDMSNAVMHVAELHAEPEYAYIIETSLGKTENKNPILHTTDDINLEFTGGVAKKKHLRKTVSHPSNGAAGEQTFAYDSTQRRYQGKDSCSNESFITISEINLRTQPSHVPPPARPPPHVRVNTGDHQSVQHAVSGERMGDSSPPFFDVEIDASSAAVASAAAMKEAMDKAQAQLKSAKELLERKREGIENSNKLGSKSDGKGKKERTSKAIEGSSDIKDDKVQGIKGKEDNGTKISVREERQKAVKTLAPDSMEGEKLFNVSKYFVVEKHGKESQSIEECGELDGADEWQEETQFFELVRTDKSRVGFQHTNTDKVFVQSMKFNEPQYKSQKASIGAVEQLESDMKVEAVREDHELEKVERDMKMAKEAKEARRHKGHEKKLKSAQEVGAEENEQSITARKLSGNGKKPNGADELGIREKRVNAQEKENKVEVQRAMEQKERAQQEKEISKYIPNPKRVEGCQEREDEEKSWREVSKQEENDIILEQVLVQAENETMLSDAVQQEEKEKKLKEAHEREERRKKEKEARELEEKEKEKKLKEAREREENEKRLREDREREEIEKKLKEAREREENEKRLREACEREEKEKKEEAHEREEKEKKLKEAREREEKEKKLKEAREREENERRLKEAREREENEKRLKEIREREEKEKKEKEVREREEKEKKLKEAREQEENEKRLKEAREREENEKRLKEACEQEENDKRLKEAREREEKLKEACEREEKEEEAREREEKERKEKEARELEESEKIWRMALEQIENEKRLKQARLQEENETRQRMVGEAVEQNNYSKPVKAVQDTEDEVNQKVVEQEVTEELQGVNYVYQQTARGENGMKQKIAKETHQPGEGEDPVIYNKVNKQDHINNHKENQLVGNNDQNFDELEETDGFVLEENGKMEAEFRDCERRTEAMGQGGVDGKFNASRTVPCDLEVKANQLRKDDISVLRHQNKGVKKADEAVVGIGQTNAENINSVSEMDSNNDKQRLKSPYEWRERARNIKEAQVSSSLEENKDKYVSAQVVNESVETGRKPEAAKASVEDGKGSTQRTVHQVKVSQNMERKDKNIIESLTPEDKEAERLKRERELELERLRKIEEEIEREREREKDRMAVDSTVLEARERGYAEARERSEKAALERATTEARQRAMADARERLEKAFAEAREKSSMEARLRAERAAVERATAEARERAVEKIMAERAASEARERVERSMSDKFSTSSRNSGMRSSYSSSDLKDQHFQSTNSFGGLRYPYASAYNGVEGESAQRCKARLERYQRTAERAAKALEEKNMRDLIAQREQAERNRLAESLDADVKRWSSGKEGNLRALLSTLQYILGPESGWQPIPLTEVITSAAVKKAYRKATLCVHPDKLQQRGASIHQKYICEKVFDLLKEAWNRFNSEER
ncbi:hypothetical protein F383_08440 [Gossypium arboreum]|uniref:J domain-containing protein n=1 Tax=Gossypium arboreum TaxID=29729 RepID=A0A0B0P9E5_GOSAR|nr:auxilin-like protein 1 [Gossypium arboreum]KHG23303.1 hypothetical protein F383_08440 [Gossypium arboreum]